MFQLRSIGVLAMAVMASQVGAAEAPATTTLTGVVDLSASATAEASNDLLSVVLKTTTQGATAQQVQQALKKSLDTALTQAKAVSKPGQIEVHTGNFYLSPRYGDKSNVIKGWEGSTELVVEGRDMVGIGQLTGQITTMNITSVNASLSREAREKIESELAAQAISRYRAKASQYAQNFGYTQYVLKEVHISDAQNQSFYDSAPHMRAAAASADALPVEPGKAVVKINVHGTVHMVK